MSNVENLENHMAFSCECGCVRFNLLKSGGIECDDCGEKIDSTWGLAQPEQEPVAWKLVPIKPTEEMLKAMDECSIEGYDERLYAGHASSVYMAAVDVAPTPPQRTWIGLTEEDMDWLHANTPCIEGNYGYRFIKAIEAKLKEKNA